MKDDVFERLRTVDPATDERILEEARALGDVPGRVTSSEPTNVRRFPRAARRRATLAAVAAVVAVAIAIPLALLRSLGEGGGTPGDDPGRWVTVGSLPEIRAQGVTYVPTPGAPTAAGAFVIARDGADPFALSAVQMEDPREGTHERVVYCPSGMFVGSRGDSYDIRGRVLGGSADHGLSPMGVRVQAGSVQIDPSDLTPGSTVNGEVVTGDSGCAMAGGAPLEGSPGFGIPLGTELPPIAVALPQSGMAVQSPITIVGSADVFEATVSIRVLDANGAVIAETFTTAACGTGCRGDFSAEVEVPIDAEQPGTIQVFESSAQDGSMINTVEIPATLVPGLDPGSTNVEGIWFDASDAPLPNGSTDSDGTEIAVFRGAEHCQWESATFMHLGWPVGAIATTSQDERQYVRDPEGLFDDGALHVGYLSDAPLPEDATDTGFHRGPWHLWVSPSQADEAVFVVNTETGAIERWGRSSEPILCA